MNWGTGIDIYTLSDVKQTASGNLLHSTSSAQGSVVTQKGGWEVGWEGSPGEKAFMYTYSGFPGGSDSKESVWSAGDKGSIPGSGRSPGKRNGNSL